MSGLCYVWFLVDAFFSGLCVSGFFVWLLATRLLRAPSTRGFFVRFSHCVEFPCTHAPLFDSPRGLSRMAVQTKKSMFVELYCSAEPQGQMPKIRYSCPLKYVTVVLRSGPLRFLWVVFGGIFVGGLQKALRALQHPPGTPQARQKTGSFQPAYATYLRPLQWYGMVPDHRPAGCRDIHLTPLLRYNKAPAP